MLKQLRLSVMVIGTALLSAACSDDSSVGVYVHGDNKDQYIELKSDQTFTLFKQGHKMEGEYAIEGNQLKLTVIIPDIAALKGQVITDSSGERWIKSE